MRMGSALVAVLLLACGPPPPGAGGNAPAPGDTVDAYRIGTVAVVGSVPTQQVVLRTDDRRQIQLEGPLAEELERLAGARVAVSGRVDGDRLDVGRYEVISVDGQPVISGVVETGEDGGLWLRTADGQFYRLFEPPPGVRPGQTIWVQGTGSLRVQRHGVIREP